jgi:hypothetical protein
MDTQSSIKSFWERPEGTTGKVVIGAVVAVGAFALYHFLPFLITLAENTIYLGVLIGILALMYMIATSTRVKSLVFYGFNMICRSITSVFVNLDPVAILEAFVRDMKNKRKVVQQAIESMMAVRNKSEQARRQKAKEMEEAMRMATVAESQPNMEEKVEELTAKIGRREQAVNALQTNVDFANETIATLQRIDRVIEYHINNSADEAEQLKQDNDMALSMLQATAAANEALGDTDKLDVRNMAAEVIRGRVAKATAEVENLLNATRSVQGEMDLSKLTLQANGRVKLDELRNKLKSAESGTSLTSGAAPVYLPAGSTPTIVGNKWSARVKVPRNNQ